ncbi:MAG TPA: hypothetical protein VFY99_11340 [Solirubrobacterales bacterium]
MASSVGDLGPAEASVLAADLTQLMREVDSFFCTEEREVAERYWKYYLVPEIERLFTPDLTIHSHYEGPSGQLLYTGYAGMHAWADDIVTLFTRFVRRNTDWQPLGRDALLVNQHVEAVGRSSGADIELNLWLLWLVREGRVCSVRTFPDRFLAESAAGAARLASDAARLPPA